MAVLVETYALFFISQRNSKSRMKCQSVDVDTDDEENEEVYGKELVGVPYR